MIQDIDKHLELISDALTWAKDYKKDAFPTAVFKEHRRKLRKIRQALEVNCSAAAYGESQVGKSYLMSGLLSSSDSPFVIQHGGKAYSFIDELNPSGGSNSKIEATGVITRFTLAKGEGNPATKGLVKVRLLSVVDLILLIVDSYYNDVKLNPATIMKYDEINQLLTGYGQLANAEAVQNYITEDDVKDINDYIIEVVGTKAIGVCQSNFCKTIAPIIQTVPFDKWVDVFSLLWNKNEFMSTLFSSIINEYRKLNFQQEVYIPFEAVMRDKGTILKIEWLNTVCGGNVDMGRDELFTDIYDKNGSLLAGSFRKGYLSALIAELTLEVPEVLSKERQFLNKLDLLDFPGARSREDIAEGELSHALPKVLRRGKVAYLFNKYARAMQISSVLFCHHNDQKSGPDVGETINTWIETNIGRTPEERAAMLMNTNKIAPLFMVATKFNLDLQRAKTETPSDLAKLDDHWDRFDTVIPEIIKPNKWLEQWVPQGGAFASSAFQNVYPLRDFYYSGKALLFEGYSDGEVKTAETNEYVHPDFPNYLSCLRESFIKNEFVKKHFANPAQAWSDCATVGNDGSKAIIRNLESIAGVLDDARRKKYLVELEAIKKDMYAALSIFFEPVDSGAKNQKVRRIMGDIRLSLIDAVGSRPEVFGNIIDRLMVPVGDLRNIAYDIVVCHTETPKDFSAINFHRINAGIDINDSREVNIKKLCDLYAMTESELKKVFADKGYSLDEIVSAETETLTTVAGVVAKHIMDHWNDYLNARSKELMMTLPHADEVVFMLISLAKKLGVKKIIQDKIDSYQYMFNEFEQPNAIADFASLTLNNFVSSVGRNYIADNELADIQAKAESCKLNVDVSSSSVEVQRKPRPLKETLIAFDESSNIINQSSVDTTVLSKLPLWGNFLRWLNLVTVGLIYASDVSHCDPEANARMKTMLDEVEKLYV